MLESEKPWKGEVGCRTNGESAAHKQLSPGQGNHLRSCTHAATYQAFYFASLQYYFLLGAIHVRLVSYVVASAQRSVEVLGGQPDDGCVVRMATAASD